MRFLLSRVVAGLICGTLLLWSCSRGRERDGESKVDRAIRKAAEEARTAAAGGKVPTPGALGEVPVEKAAPAPRQALPRGVAFPTATPVPIRTSHPYLH